MSGKPSADVVRAMQLVRRGMTPYAAARQTGIALSTIYRSAIYKAWKARLYDPPTRKEQ
jgi:hypothetical protein